LVEPRHIQVEVCWKASKHPQKVHNQEGRSEQLSSGEEVEVVQSHSRVGWRFPPIDLATGARLCYEELVLEALSFEEVVEEVLKSEEGAEEGLK
jgi:hypothetical protein